MSFNAIPSKVFNPNPTEGNQVSFPTAPQNLPYQLTIQQGVVNFAASSTAGLIVILPKWAEKIMGWHYPQHPDTKTMDAAQPLSFTMDLDSFYSLYRMVSMSVGAVTTSLSAGSIAIGGMVGAVQTYNSLAYCIGNGSSVYQIYSYGNLAGLTPDPASKVVGLPFWKGVGAWTLGDLNEKFNRLEDSATYSPGPEVKSDASFAKFVNKTDIYSLNQIMELSYDPSQTWALSYLDFKEFDLGEVLKDGLRASTVQWWFNTELDIFNPSLVPTYQRSITIQIFYKAYDLAGQVVNSGYLMDENLPLTSVITFTLARSGAFPDLFNVNEEALQPPVRSVKYWLKLTNYDPTVADPIWFGFKQTPVLRVNYDIPNGLTTGLTQNPILIAYDGVEVGQQISVNCSVLLEAIPDSATAKFTNPVYRKTSASQEQAIRKIAANPLKYGIKWVVPLDQTNDMMLAFRHAVNFEMAKGEQKLIEGLKLIKSLTTPLVTKDDPNPKISLNEASARSIWKKIEKGLKTAGKTTYNEILKPVAKEELERLKELPKQAATHFLEGALSSLAATGYEYQSPKATYIQPNTSYITPQAATGFIPKAAIRPKYVACVDATWFRARFEKVITGGDYDSLSPGFIAAVRNPALTRNVSDKNSEKSNEVRKREPPTSYSEFEIPNDCVTLFPTVNLTKDGDLEEDDLHSSVEIFEIVPARMLKKLPKICPFIEMGGKKVFNYALYDPARGIDKLSVVPKEDVYLLRLVKRGRDKSVVEITNIPVGGRSLDLAMYAFNNGFCGKFVYTGAVDSGSIGRLADDMMLLKNKYCHDNHFVTVGNGTNFDINVSTLIGLSEFFRKAIRTIKSGRHYNAVMGESAVDLRMFTKFNWLDPVNSTVIPYNFHNKDHFPTLPDSFADYCTYEETGKYLIIGQIRDVDIMENGKLIKGVLCHDISDFGEDPLSPKEAKILIQLSQKEQHNLNKWIIAKNFNIFNMLLPNEQQYSVPKSILNSKDSNEPLFSISLSNTNEDYFSPHSSLHSNSVIPIAMLSNTYSRKIQKSKTIQNRNQKNQKIVACCDSTTQAANLSANSLFFTMLENYHSPEFKKAEELFTRKLNGSLNPREEKEFRRLTSIIEESARLLPIGVANNTVKIQMGIRGKPGTPKYDEKFNRQRKDLSLRPLSASQARSTVLKWARTPMLNTLLTNYSTLLTRYEITDPKELIVKSATGDLKVIYSVKSIEDVLVGKSYILGVLSEDKNPEALFSKNRSPFFWLGVFHYWQATHVGDKWVELPTIESTEAANTFSEMMIAIQPQPQINEAETQIQTKTE